MSEREQGTNGSAQSEAGAEAREERLRTLLASAYPASALSPALRQRVAELAVRHEAAASERLSPQRRLLRWTPLRAALGLAAATVLAFAYVALSPTWTAAQVLRRAEAAINDVRSAHVIDWRIAPDGSRTKAHETWYQGGRWRMEGGPGDARPGIQVYADGKLWTYEPKLNKVSLRRQEGGPFGYNPSGFSLRAMMRDFSRWGWRDKFQVLGDTTVGARRYHRVSIERANEPVRITMLVDTVTDLPAQMEMQMVSDGQWRIVGSIEFVYNEPLPARLFEPKFPASAQMFDLDRGQQEWGRRLAKGIARQQVGDRIIVIRDLQVNADGDVFLLYTAGKRLSDALGTGNYLAGRDWKVDLSDEFGTIYLWQGGRFWPTLTKQHPRLPNGYIFHGEKLEGDWWTPLALQSPWKPRRFTITFRVSPVNLHGSYNDPPVEARYTELARFTLAVQRPAAALLPDYMPYMADPVQESFLARDRLRAQAAYYHHRHRDLARALALYQEVIRRRDEQSGQPGGPPRDPQTWLDIGKIQHDLGHREEARAAFERSLRETSRDDYSRKQAQEALESLQGELAWSVGRRAPSFTAMDLKGKRQSPERYRGKVLLIDIWTTFDPENRAKLPALKALYDRYGGRGFAILGINMDCNLATFEEFVKAHPIDWPQVRDGKCWTSPLARTFGQPQTPRTILVDRQGTIRAIDAHGPSLEKSVTDLLGKSSHAE